ncbi:MAG: ATP-binding protein [Candidatus Marinimicrobia bacterium]|nr:ATP-binding protein [Candidatus Neomarinimicrobiota bacterium]
MNINRNAYWNKIKPFVDKPIIKVITGMRRVGKSYFLKQIIDNLKMNGIKDSQILFVDKENIDFDFLNDYNDLNKYIKEKFKKINLKKYIFIDEIQNIIKWEKLITSLHKSENYDIYITGSNASLLSSELSTLIAGRYVEINIYPLSYREFVKFTGNDFVSHEKCFSNYIKFGGMPGIFHLEQTAETIFQYLKSIYDTILLKDIVKRYNIRNIALLEKISLFMFDNIGNLITPNSISKYLRSQKLKTYPDTIQNYLKYFTNTFIAYKVPRYNLKGKKLMEINDKYYLNDLGIRHSLLNYRVNDISQILENIVFMELLFRGYNVTIGMQNENEIDFIARKNNEIIYFQVAYLLASEKTIQREFNPLMKIKNNYTKFVLSMDSEIMGDDFEGIKRMNIIDFLKGK